MPKQQIVRRQIVDSTGSYVVSYLPGRKIEIKLPGTKHVVIVGPLRSRKNTGIVVVNPQGAVTSIPTYDPDRVALMRDGLQAVTVFVPVMAKDTEHD